MLPLGGFSENDLLQLAAIADKRSEHPLAEAIVKGARDGSLEVEEPDEFKAIPGHGVEATVKGRRVFVGNRKLMERENISLTEFKEGASRLADEGKTPMFVSVEGRPAGIIAVADTIKEDSIAAIRALHKLKIVFLIGWMTRTGQGLERESEGSI